MENFKSFLTSAGSPNGEAAYSENNDYVEAYNLHVETNHYLNRGTNHDTSWLGRMGWKTQAISWRGTY